MYSESVKAYSESVKAYSESVRVTGKSILVFCIKEKKRSLGGLVTLPLRTRNALLKSFDDHRKSFLLSSKILLTVVKRTSDSSQKTFEVIPFAF